MFALYVIFMLIVLLTPIVFRGQNVFVGGLTWDRYVEHIAMNWNLIPLRSITQQISALAHGDDVSRHLIYLCGNIIGFIPLGYFLPTLFPRLRRFRAFLLTVVIACACLELVQLLTMRGSFDIDDIILNTFGACLGFWVTRTLTPATNRNSRK